jgi:hypothetical protein
MNFQDLQKIARIAQRWQANTDPRMSYIRALTVTQMSEADAQDLGVNPSKRKGFVRVDPAKFNLSPATSHTNWFQFHSVKLNNGNEEYPDGDEIGVVVRWQGLSPLCGITWKQVETVLDKLDTGPGDGEFYSSTKSSSRWAVPLLMKSLGLNQANASVLLKEWIATGVLVKGSYTSKERGNQAAQQLMASKTGRIDLEYRFNTRA